MLALNKYSTINSHIIVGILLIHCIIQLYSPTLTFKYCSDDTEKVNKESRMCCCQEEIFKHLLQQESVGCLRIIVTNQIHTSHKGENMMVIVRDGDLMLFHLKMNLLN